MFSAVRAVQIVGIFVFVIIVVFALLFAEGYQYDSLSRDLVKTGIIYFKGLSAGESLPSVYVNGKKMSISSPGELRLVPGAYDLEIKQDGFFPFKKQILIPTEEVLTFDHIGLFPQDQQYWPLKENIEKLDKFSIHSVSQTGVFLFNKKENKGEYYFFDSPSKPESVLIPSKATFLRLLAISPVKFIGLGKDGKLLSFENEPKKNTVIVDAGTFVDMVMIGESVYAIDKAGKVWKRKAVAPLAEVVGNRFKKTAKNGDYKMFIFADENLFILNNKDEVVYQDKSVTNAILGKNDELVFIKKSDLISYDLKEGKIIKFVPKVGKSIVWISRISDSFHLLALNNENKLFYCDLDLGNCQLVEKLDLSFVESFDNGNTYFVIKNGYLTTVGFGAKKELPELFHDFVSETILSGSRYPKSFF